MPNEQLTNSERGHYEETITRLSGASSLQKIIAWLILVLVILALCLQIKSSNDAVKRANIASEKRTQIVQEVQSTTDSQNKLIESQLNTVNRHIDCVIAFFTYQDRTSLTIADIDNCTFDRAGEVLKPDTTSTGSVPLNNPQPKTSSPSSSSGTTPPASSGSSQSSAPSVKVTPNCKVDLLFIHLGC